MKSARNQRGQVAIFVALIFQLLFLFFAMVVNVGLLVHHKINLQNSVDLAAYYGASKQAEMLNAMAHVNYQIRQSWKLLAWRYRVIGSGGDRMYTPGTRGNPFYYDGANPSNSDIIVPQSVDEENSESMLNTSGGGSVSKAAYYRLPAFCVNYTPFSPAASRSENTCRQISENNFKIQVLQIPSLSVRQTYAGAVVTNVTNARAAQVTSCQQAGTINFSILTAMAVGFDFDQYARRLLIAQMSKALSSSENAFYDIDGENARDGIRKTLQNNLTIANRESLTSFDIYNGLGSSSCAGAPAAQEAASWLSNINIFPLLLYQDNAAVGDSDNSCAYNYKIFFNTTGNNQFGLPLVYQNDPGRLNSISDLKKYVDDFKDFTGKPPDDYRYTLGYEKDPWCMAYVGVKAKTQPKIPFAPAIVELSAKSFAKPFGGRFGPWYYKRWDRGSNSSSGGPNDRVDLLAPNRLTGTFDETAMRAEVDLVRNSLTPGAMNVFSSNYSRFPGDKIGLMSMRVLGEYTRAVHSVASEAPPRNDLSIANWLHITDPPSNTDHADMLYWNPTSPRPPLLREIEVGAVAPDIFDTTYYSIDPNFYENYFDRITKGSLLQKINYQLKLRGDIGSRQTADKDENGKELKKFSVKDQISIFNKIRATDPVKNQYGLNSKTILLHTLTNPFQSLTAWNAKNLLSYGALDNESKAYFGKCVMTTDDDVNGSPAGKSIKSLAPDRLTPAPGDCVVGGRTGYSVKMISEQYLNSTMEIGGAGASSGTIKNPPPSGW